MAGKEVKQFEFARGEIHHLSVEQDAARQRIDRQTVRLNLPVRLCLPHRLLTAEQRFDAGNQLLHRKRLSQIVIGTGFQPGNAVGFAAAGADDDDRQVARHLTDASANLQPVNAREHQVEDHRIPRLFFQALQGVAPVGLVGDGVAFIF